MITVGLIKELFFISTVLNEPLSMEFKTTGNAGLVVKVDGSTLEVWYKGEHIWREQIEGEDAFFGVESCDSISRAIACLNNGDESWKNYVYGVK